MNLRAAFSAFVKEGGIGLALLVLVVLLVWLGGDYFGVNPTITYAIIAGLVALGVLAFVVRRVIARQQSKKLANKFMELAAEDADASLAVRKQTQQEIAEKLREGIGYLRTSEHGEDAVSKLPWYLVVGPANAGKSSVLEASGLEFAPLGRVRKPVAEAGTTRDLDWWMTKSAVFLDVPGRYISDNNSPFEWPAFVAALREARSQAPVSGVIVVLPVPELIALKNDEVEPYAKNIRDRLDELAEKCRWVFPVYVLFTKCDRVRGFAEAFGNLAEEDRRQAWGATLRFAIDEHRNCRTIFHDECNRLAEPMREQILAALTQDGPPAIKEQTALFPRQMFLAQKRMGEVIGAIFRPNPFIETGLLRGFYFLSTTQDGPLIDLIAEKPIDVPRPAERAPYFISQIFTGVLPPDQNLARLSIKEGKRRRALAAGAAALSLAASLALAAVFLLAFVDHKTNMERLTAAREQSDETLRMDALRDALIAADENRPLASRVPFAGRPAGRLADAARSEYFTLAKKHVVQPAAEQLQRDMRKLREQRAKSMADYDSLLAHVSALRMLSGAQAPDTSLRPMVLAALSNNELLLRQADYLLADPQRLQRSAAGLDTGLMEGVGQDLRGALWIEAAWNDIVSNAPRELAPFTRDALITAPGREYVDIKPVPGLYTQRGYDDYAGGAIERRAQDLAQRFAQMGEKKQPWEFSAALSDRYSDEHALAWNNAQESLTLKDVEGLQECVLALKSLCGRESALRALMVALRDGRRLKLSNGTERNVSQDDLKWLDAALGSMAEIPQALDTMLQAGSAASPVLDYRLAGKLEALVTNYNDTARALDAALDAAPAAVRDRARLVLARLFERAAEELRQQAQAEANALWSSSFHEAFKSDAGSYFPFNAQSAGEAPLGAVARLFNPKSGKLWTAMKALDALRALLINRKPLIQYSEAFIAAVGRAQKLRDALFAADAETISVKISVILERGEKSDDVSLCVGDKTVTHYDLAGKAAELTWSQEKPTGSNVQARVGGQWLARDFATASWGMVRMFGDATRTKLGEGRMQCEWTFKQGESVKATARAEFTFKSGINAFDPALFQELALPDTVN